jgi:hypothetical protein
MKKTLLITIMILTMILAIDLASADTVLNCSGINKPDWYYFGDVGGGAPTLRYDAQSFTPSSNISLDAISFYIAGKSGTPGNVNVSLYFDNGGDQPYDSFPLNSSCYGSIGGGVTSAWNTYNFSNNSQYCILNASVKYWIVIKTAPGGGSNYYKIGSNNPSDCAGSFSYGTDTPGWTTAGTYDMSIYIFNKTIPGATITPAIGYNANTTTESSYYNNTHGWIYSSFAVTDFPSSNTTIKLYNTSGLYSTITGLSNYSYNFTSLPPGNYTLNATASNGTTTINISTSKIYKIYSMILNISNPSTTGQEINEYLNISYVTNIDPNVSTIIGYNISLLNSDLSNNRSLINNTANNSLNWNVFDENLSLGSYAIKIIATNNYSEIINTTSNLFNFSKNALLNLSAALTIDNSSIINFSVQIIDNNNTENRSYNTTNGSINIPIIKSRSYTIYLDATGYALSNETISTNNISHQNHTMRTYTENSVSINIYDETTNLLITQNITIEFTQNLSDIINTTTTGMYYQDGLADGTWNIKFSGGNYTLKSYTITVANRSTQNLNAYLSANSQYSIFNIIDFDSSAVIEGASFTQSKIINGSWTVINSKSSDITGRVQFDYIPNAKYQFLISATGYDDNLFYLDPVLFSTYNIRMTKTTTLSPTNTADYLGIYISYYNNNTGDTTWNNNNNNTLIWIISSPIGSLEKYNITIELPQGINISQNGILANGEQFTQNFTINSTNTSDRLIINYCYESTTSYPKCFRFPHTIIGVYANTSMLANKDQTYGLGVFERVLLVTIIVLFVGGMVFIYGGAIPGLVVTLFVYGFTLSTGFVTIWMIFPSLFVGFIMIVSTSKGGGS